MKIGMILEGCEVGDQVTTEGQVSWAGKPRNITGSKDGKPYDFWSQFVVLQDGDNKVGCDLSFNNEIEAIAKDATLKVKGVLAEYQKDGKTNKKIARSKIVTAVGGKTTSGDSGGKPNGKNRAFALSYTKDLAVAGIVSLDDIRAITTEFCGYLDNGDWLGNFEKSAPGAQAQGNPDYVGDEPTPPSDDIPF